MSEKGKLPVRQDIFTVLSSVLGIGFLPKMPGTFGTLAAAAVYLCLPSSLVMNFPQALCFAAALIILYFIGVFITGKAEYKLGHDAGSIVFDEFIAYFMSVWFLPKSMLMAIYTFALFRVFDIAKPWPIKLSQKLKGGWGVMTDDVIAAVYTNLLMQILVRIYPHFFI